MRLRPITLRMALLWCAFGAFALAKASLASFYNKIGVMGEQVSDFTKIGITLIRPLSRLHWGHVPQS
ncbi:hypothetical protein X772_32090 [Mesorhizobium sp. LSJC280B00]|nr:hypothetical protein X772_32090 [Mesorhizobium sp. LSJC280B00]